ncbi:MAG: single-stranded-DNA-specific exonuclease RecJ [Candidatus Pacebacteria bacterium]|nr:single-stranded-DNA-specific exonuclease RecJ [Candidatus Paceibacterota bacterium]
MTTSTQENREEKTKESDALDVYPSLLRTLLANRGIATREEAEHFLHPDYGKHLHDPFLMKDMGRAVDRILVAMKNKEMIAIYSDFDCDGIPGGVVLHDFFKKVEYKKFTNYIPHRHEEGYGLNACAIDKLNEQGVSLIITVDVGITDVDAVAHANELGIEVIITDHHLPGDELPEAYAIVNAKQADDTYPFDGLCGAGVAWKLVTALIQKGDKQFGGEYFAISEGWEKWLLDVVGIATVADMVPLTGENRVLAHYGLMVLRKSPRPGLMKLFRKMWMKQHEITEDDIGFMIAPRINAASRMDRPDEAFHLLATRDEAEGGMYAEHLHKINNERKGVVAAMVREIRKEIAERDSLGEVIVMGNPKWKPSLLGLAANSLVDEHGKTVCLWGEEGGGVLKGSCRSNGEVSVVSLMKAATHSLIAFGGHHFSGGFSVTRECVHELEAVLNTAYEQVETLEKEGSIQVDATLTPADVSWSTYRLINQLAPFGEGNPKPIFLFENVLIESVRRFGKTMNHLEVCLADNGRVIPAIAFFRTEESFEVDIAPGKNVNVVAHIERSTFGRSPELRLRIVDIR